LFLVLGILAGAGYYVTRSFSPSGKSADEADQDLNHSVSGIVVEVIHPIQGGMDRISTQPGTVQAYYYSPLLAYVSGYLKYQHVDIGDHVKKGQVLAIIDVPDLEAQVKRNKAALEQAKVRVIQMVAHKDSAAADLEAAKAAVPQAEATAKSAAAMLRFREKQFKRMKELFKLESIDERLVDEKYELRDVARESEVSAIAAVATSKAKEAAARARLKRAEADIKAAQAEVEVAKADLQKSEVMKDFATITSPYDGVITQRSRYPGSFVRAATEGGDHTPLLTVEQIDKVKVIVQIPDRDVPFTDIGDPAIIELDALPGKILQGKVSRKADSEDHETRLMRVEIDLDNPDGKIAPGMFGKATILLEKSHGLSVPSSCLVGKVAGGKGSVYVVRDNHAHLVPVEIGGDDGLHVAIVRGLRSSDKVILSHDTVTEGALVSPTSEMHARAETGH
jgi:RND family efflux transporter MFP subunit